MELESVRTISIKKNNVFLERIYVPHCGQLITHFCQEISIKMNNLKWAILIQTLSSSGF
jgi:hypothetical protein